MTQKIRVGIVGANAERGWARDAHLAALRTLDSFEVTAVSARSQANANAAAAVFKAPLAFGDTLAMVRESHVDLVVVTVKVPEHRAVVLAALAAGKHVYCEWPLGKDVQEGEALAAAVPPHVQAVTGLQGLSSPVLRQAAEMIGAGVIGKPRRLRAFSAAGAWGSQTPDFYRYLQDKRSGATFESIGGGHTLAAIEMLVGSYQEVDARCTTFDKRVAVLGSSDAVERSCADHMFVIGLHQSGCVSSLEVIGGRTEEPVRFEVQGERGWLRVVGTAPGMCQIAPLRLECSAELDGVREPVAPELSGPAVNVAEAYACLAERLAGGDAPLPDFAAALRLHRLVAAVGRASQTGVRQRPLGA